MTSLFIASAAIAIVCGFLAWLIRKHPAAPWEWWREMAWGSLRCSGCGVSWPNVPKDFQPCPVCLGRTDSISDKPIDAAEAHTKMCNARFERYLDENNRRDPVEELERIPVEEKAA